MNLLQNASMFHAQLLGIPWMDPNWLLEHFGSEFFWISVAIVFIECGLLFPFLPGDSLLFAIGLFIAGGKLDMFGGSEGVDLLVSLLLLGLAAFAGNVAGYEIGRRVGPPIYNRDGRILQRKYFDQTHAFFEKHGVSALVIGRFVPFVRTFITVVAGATKMERSKFLLWSFIGAWAWVISIVLLGFFLGAAFPALGNSIDKMIIVIIGFSLIPVLFEWWRQRRKGADAH